MSNYTKTTDFEAKDSLPSGDSGKIIKGAEFETEFDNIATAVATKSNTAGPTFTGTLTYATLNDGTTALTSTVAELNALDGITSTVAELNILDGVTSTAAELNILDGVTSTAAELNILDGVTSTAAELNLLDGVTSTTAELNILDGVTSSAAELNILDGVTSTAAELNLADGSSAGTIVNSKALIYGSSGEVNATTLQIAGASITSTAAELNILDGVTSTAAELNILDGVTSTAAELNILDGVTSTAAELNILDGVTSSAAELNILDGKAFLDEDNLASDSATGIASQQSIKAYVDGSVSSVTPSSTTTLTNKTLTSPKINEDVVVTSTATEINLLDGVTSTTAELNILDGVTSTAAELNILDGVTSTAAELNILDGVTSTTAELNILDGVTSTTAELNILDGVTSTAAELNILDGVTSTAAELNKLDGVGTLKQAGLETIYVPASAMYPNTTAGCAALAQVELTNGPELKCLDFADGEDDHAQFTVCFPKSWNEGVVQFQAFWTVTGTNDGSVAWGLSGVSFPNNADMNHSDGFGTNVVATALDHSGTSNDMMVSAVSNDVTIRNAAVDTMTVFQVMRDISADDQTGDARLLGIKLFFTTDAANDA